MKKNDILKLLDGAGGNLPDVYFNAESLARGIEVEMEHTSNPMVAKIITRQHLFEFPDYYEYLFMMEEKLKKEENRY